MKTTTRLMAGTTATMSLFGLGALGAGAASASEPPRHDNHPVVRHDDPNRDHNDGRNHRDFGRDHRNHHGDFRDHRDHRHHDLLAICRTEHRPYRTYLIRVNDRDQLRYLERRFDLDCRVIRVLG